MTAKQKRHHLQQQTIVTYCIQKQIHKQQKFRSENSVG